MVNLSPAPAEGSRSQVRLTVPADGAFVYVLRTTAASLASRLEFTVDDVEDFRIAIGEAASLLVSTASGDADLDCSFDLGRSDAEATLTVESAGPLDVDADSFAWQVLSTLTASCAHSHEDGRTTITLSVRSILDPEDAPAVGEQD
ncbi:hypothetical protein IEQ44_02895 [Nocardioides sp. Y6]|uniref:Anti-sigma factor n=2 Tax=Nocardioides malaquae TaxID=2773426 RepID=A0ABR9RPW8_9ACTN|nr:hypothetical protein [Nocardioides malaquae]